MVVRRKVVDTVVGYGEPVLVSYYRMQLAEHSLELTKDRLCLLNDRLDVHGQLLRLSSDIAACSGNYEWIGIAVCILQVESFEEDGRGGDYPLAIRQFLAEL